MKQWPALDASGIDRDFLLAEVDDFSPTAAEDHGDAFRVFFTTPDSRDRALAHLARRQIRASLVDVPDEDWARRSQENITPVRVGRIVVTPPWHLPDHADPRTRPNLSAPDRPDPPDRPDLPGRPDPSSGPALYIVIEPSMGFGTGHHATTRLCLAALQEIDLNGRVALDVGTGSGVLAIAAARLGAREARGLDNDADAVQNARDNLALNPLASGVRFDVADLAHALEAGVADVITANLTGALLERSAPLLLTAARPGGTIILSGLMVSERPSVAAAFSPARLVSAREEGEWVALVFETSAG